VQARKLIAEGKTGVEEGDKNGEGGLMLFRAYRGLPKSKPLIKFLSETGVRAVLQATENHYLQTIPRRCPRRRAAVLHHRREEQPD
jgi:preprotein translocase subunit SecA